MREAVRIHCSPRNAEERTYGENFVAAVHRLGLGGARPRDSGYSATQPSPGPGVPLGRREHPDLPMRVVPNEALHPRGLVPPHVVTGALHRVAPVVVRHAVVVLLAECGEVDRDRNAFEPVVFEVGIDRNQLWLRIPA